MRAFRLEAPLILLLIVALAVAPLHGQTAGQPGPISKAAEREAVRLARQAASVPPAQSETRAKPSKGWISTHPVAFGALVGTAAGLAFGIYSARCDPKAETRCSSTSSLAIPFGAGFGAAIGTGVGLLAALIQWQKGRRHDTSKEGH
jgi:hypothetical protein